VGLVAFGSVCEVASRGELARLSFELKEFAELRDGSRLVLRADRGWSSVLRVAYDGTGAVISGATAAAGDPWRFTTRESLTKAVLACVDPEDEEQQEQWLVDRLAELGVDVDVAAVREMPYRVEFGPILEDRLRQRDG
jgi:hypothetical protein